MRIVIDMQGAQTESRYRGIGRYTLGFVQGIVRNREKHKVILVLNDRFPETIAPIREAFFGLLPQEDIRVFRVPEGVAMTAHNPKELTRVAEILRESFLADLCPDVVHVCSPFEGFEDDAVFSVGEFDLETPISVTLHDLIPLLNPGHYFGGNPVYERFYRRRVESLSRAQLFLAISESSRNEGIGCLAIAPDAILNTSEAVEPEFCHQTLSEAEVLGLRGKFGIQKAFVLYTGGCDERKNLERLIQAFAKLPDTLRKKTQLVLAGRMPVDGLANLKSQALQSGVEEQVVFTGYVTDNELIELYNLCEVYAFPSWHEGFGLPVLEAMACGAAVICSNTSSLPEVVGLAEATFSPFDTDSIASKMKEVLEDAVLRQSFRRHGLEQSKKFSWDITARRAIAAWEALPKRNKSDSNEIGDTLSALAPHLNDIGRMGVGLVASMLAANQQSSIMRQLFLDVSELSQRDSGTGVQRVVRSYLHQLLKNPPKGFVVAPVYATTQRGYCYARQFSTSILGNDADLKAGPIQWQRGDVFFGLDMQHHVQLAQGSFIRQLRSEGVVVKFLVHDLLPIQLAEHFKDSEAKSLHEAWLKLIAQCDGAICVSKATQEAYAAWIKETNTTVSPGFTIDWVHNGSEAQGYGVVDQPSNEANCMRQIASERTTFLAVSTIEPRKGYAQILAAFDLLWQSGLDVNLIIVGNAGWKTDALVAQIESHSELGKRLFWLRGIDDVYLNVLYESADCLIAASINEGFGLPIVEAAIHGLPIIARDIGVFKEIAGTGASYFSGVNAESLETAVRNWLGLYAVNKHPDPAQISSQSWAQSTQQLTVAILDKNCPRKQLLVDISELVARDAKSGIQRVVRSILKEWVLNPPVGYRVEPVYATTAHSYRYARQFMAKFAPELQMEFLKDSPIDFGPGDVFFGLDLQPVVIPAQQEFLAEMHRHGVKLSYLVHDLLPLMMPEYFPEGSGDGFRRWLDVVAQGDAAVCVSQTVAEELRTWLQKNHPEIKPMFEVLWSHNGSDIASSVPTTGLPDNSKDVIAAIGARPSFLMVGTLEPRKGYTETLDAFDVLWANGEDVSLVIVGKRGWKVDSLSERIETHPEKNSRLFWLEGISDEYLEQLYQHSACLIAASYGEGFGLPLIEAAAHQIPILARDIPVFKEVGGSYATYFNSNNGVEMALFIQNWIPTLKAGKATASLGLPSLTWRESARHLKDLIL